MIVPPSIVLIVLIISLALPLVLILLGVTPILTLLWWLIKSLHILCLLSRPSDPCPTRLEDPNQSPGCETIYILYCTGTLIDLLYSQSCTCTYSIQTIFVITKIIYIYQKNYHLSGVHHNLYTYIKSHLNLQILIHVHF